MKTWCIFLGLLGIFSGLSAQIPKTGDSLEVYLKTHPQDTNYVKALADYSFIMAKKGDFKVADSLAGLMGELSDKLDYKRGMYFHSNMLGVMEYLRQNHAVAAKHFLKTKEIAERYGLSPRMYQRVLGNLVLVYGHMTDRGKASEYALQLIRFQEKHALHPFQTAPYTCFGDNLKFSGDFKQALVYYDRALAIETEYKNLTGMAVVENKIGNTREAMGETEEALKHFHKGLEYAREADFALLQTDMLSNLGRVYIALKDFTKAERYLKESEGICRELGSPNSLQLALSTLGDFYRTQRRYLVAEKYYTEAREIAVQQKDPEEIYTTTQALAEFYAETGDFPRAYELKTAAEAARDSSYKLESEEISRKLMTEYETERKEQEIALLNEKNRRAELQNRSVLAGGILLVLLTGVTFFFLVNRNKLRRLEESERLRNKIASDLHDEVGSTLSSILLISEMAQNRENSETGKKMFAKINADSKHMAESMDEIIWSVSPVNDSLQGIMVRLREYVHSLAPARDIRIDFHSEEGVEEVLLPMETRRNLYLIVKEALNNLVKHSGATEATVQLTRVKNTVSVHVSDNGTGFDIAKATGRNGLRNMQIRATEAGGSLDIVSEPGRGTQINICFPVT